MKISVLSMQKQSQRWIWMAMLVGGLAVGETHEEMYHDSG